MEYLTRASVIAASLVVASSSRLSLSALAFTPPNSSASLKRKASTSNHGSNLMVLYQEGSEQEAYTATPTSAIQDISMDLSNPPHIDDSSYELILNNPHSLPVLVDCYTDKCGPCKLIERTLQQTLPKYTSSTNTRLSFAKWDTETKDSSEHFMSLLREHSMIFRVLPTLLLFMDGIPVAMKSGMMSAAALERFLEEHVPSDEPKEGERRPKVRPDGALGISTRKMNR